MKTETNLYQYWTLQNSQWVAGDEPVEAKGRKVVVEMLKEKGHKNGTFKVRLAE